MIGCLSQGNVLHCTVPPIAALWASPTCCKSFIIHQGQFAKSHTAVSLAVSWVKWEWVQWMSKHWIFWCLLDGTRKRPSLRFPQNWLSWQVKDRSPLRSWPECLWLKCKPCDSCLECYRPFLWHQTLIGLSGREERSGGCSGCELVYPLYTFKWDWMLMSCTIVAFSFVERITRAILSSLIALISMRLRVAWYYNEEFCVVPDQCLILWGECTLALLLKDTAVFMSLSVIFSQPLKLYKGV